MSYYSSYGSTHNNEQVRKEFRKKLALGGNKPWCPPVEMTAPNLSDRWLVSDSRGRTRKEYYFPCQVRLGRCPFPQTITFHAEVCDEMRVRFFDYEAVSKDDALKNYACGDIDKRLPPFSFENTTTHQLTRIAKAMEWLCRGEFDSNGKSTNEFPWVQEAQIFIKTATRPEDNSVYLCVTDGKRSDEIKLWDYEFFPPSGVEAVIKLLVEIRNLSIKWFW